MSFFDRLKYDIELVCPVITVRVGQRAARETWTFEPAPAATGPQIAAAQAVITNFDDSAGPQAVFEEMLTSATVGRVTPKRLSADISTTSNALQDVAALAFQLAPNRHYSFEFTGAYFSAAGGTGIQLAVNGPAGATGLVMAEIHESATARRSGVATAYNVPLVGQNSGGATRLPWRVWGNISTGATGGGFLLRACSEVNGSQVTILAGSYGLLHCVG